MNITLLRQVQEQILKEPLQFDMRYYFGNAKTDWSKSREGVRVDIPNCGTTACIAGWAIAFDRQLNPRDTQLEVIGPCRNEGERVLDLSPDQGNRLFHLECWPMEFQCDWFNVSPQRQAEIAVARIEHFIKTNGEE